MIIKQTPEIINEIKKYLAVKELNISAAEFYIDYLNNYYNSISNSDIINLSKKYDSSQSFFKAMIKKMNVSEQNQELTELISNSKINIVHKLKTDVYLNDEFVKTIGLINCKENDCSFMTLNYLPYEGFVLNELEIDQNYYAEQTPFGYFEENMPYLAVLKNDCVWMSVIPHEINTMKEPINNAFGKVLVLGLGLGYYAFHVSNKDDVESVTIVENDPTIINIFEKYIFPKFKNKKKIHIINQDAFKQLEEQNDYDFVFSDIWHNVSDGLPLYLKIKQYEKFYPNTRFEYWIETSMLAMLRRQLLTVIEETQFLGLKESDYLKSKNINDQIINSIYFALKDSKIDNVNDLRILLSDDTLKFLANKLKIG